MQGEDPLSLCINERVATALLLLCCAGSTAMAQPSDKQNGHQKSGSVEYRAGQVWRTPFGASVIVLIVEDVRKIGKVVHVRVELPGQSCGNIHLTTKIDHLAVPEKIMRKSALYLAISDVPIPDSYLEGYRGWVKQKNHEMVKLPVQDEIMRVAGFSDPMICNFVPSQT
jgi:hypothetical protein